MLDLVLSIILAVGALCYYYHQYYYNPNSVRFQPRTLHTTMFNSWAAIIQDLTPQTFRTTNWVGPNGVGVEITSISVLLTESETEQKLKANEAVVTPNAKRPFSLRFDKNVLPSNTSCEDRHSIDWLEYQDIPRLREDNGESFWLRWHQLKQDVKARGKAPDLVFCSVLDGHCGFEMSELMNKTLHASLAHAIGSIKQLSPTSMAQCIRDTFVAIDAEVLRAPLAALIPSETEENALLPSPAPSVLHTAKLDHSGSCCLTAMLDRKNSKLYVANLGDCRAVAGWYNQKTGAWSCDVLSEDQCGSNPAEEARVRAEHPNENIMFDKGHGMRILGLQDVSRAFGDSGTKRTEDELDTLSKALQIEQRPRYYAPSVSPPYASTEPVVVVRDTHQQDGFELKLIILATDGLWNRLSAEEAVLLTAAQTTGKVRAAIDKSDLPARIPLEPPTEPRPYPADPLPATTDTNRQGKWFFRDDNAATHLVRNAIALGDEKTMRQMLSMTPGVVTRQMRDDITAVVLKIDEQA